jgi:hypothetical protein
MTHDSLLEWIEIFYKLVYRKLPTATNMCFLHVFLNTEKTRHF